MEVIRSQVEADPVHHLGQTIKSPSGTDLLCVHLAAEPHRVYCRLDGPKEVTWTSSSKNVGSFAGMRSPD